MSAAVVIELATGDIVVPNFADEQAAREWAEEFVPEGTRWWVAEQLTRADIARRPER